MEFTFTHNNPHDTELTGNGITYIVSSTRSMPVNGKDINVKDFFKKEESYLDTERSFKIGAESFTWRASDSLFTLERGNAPIAEMERKQLRSSTLFVAEDAAPLLDTIIMSLIMMWTIQRRRV
ncbi:hypothetical protein BKA62DRAFT_832817 [Auriculariales sp. MPI-PUGE-AT-0066]|nr:hypothetical protein BKA62DRAFT_832817 [Auriculariales sp. MPI-PUGE-AT-0066]